MTDAGAKRLGCDSYSAYLDRKLDWTAESENQTTSNSHTPNSNRNSNDDGIMFRVISRGNDASQNQPGPSQNLPGPSQIQPGLSPNQLGPSQNQQGPSPNQLGPSQNLPNQDPLRNLPTPRIIFRTRRASGTLKRARQQTQTREWRQQQQRDPLQVQLRAQVQVEFQVQQQRSRQLQQQPQVRLPSQYLNQRSNDTANEEIESTTPTSQFICHMCLRSPAASYILNCGHLPFCSECSLLFIHERKKCPICKTCVTSRQRAYVEVMKTKETKKDRSSIDPRLVEPCIDLTTSPTRKSARLATEETPRSPSKSPTPSPTPETPPSATFGSPTNGQGVKLFDSPISFQIKRPEFQKSIKKEIVDEEYEPKLVLNRLDDNSGEDKIFFKSNEQRFFFIFCQILGIFDDFSKWIGTKGHCETLKNH